MKAFKTFIKPFKAPQKSVEKKLKLSTLLAQDRGGLG